MKASKVSVNLLTYNSRAYLPGCLSSVLAQSYPYLEVTVIDNGSTDGSVAYLREHHPELKIIVNSENRGYSAAHNQGIRLTDGEYVLLVNPDVWLESGYVATLVEVLARNERAGAAMGKLYTFGSRGGAARVLDSVGVYVCKNRRTLDRGQGEVDKGQYEALMPCFGASGAAPLYRRAMLEDVAVNGEYFDEDFFAYREEVDLAWRSRWLGWECLFVPGAVGYHDRTYTLASRPRMPRFLRQHMVKNRYLLLLKNDQLAHMLRHLPHILWFEARLWSHSLLFEPYLLHSLGQVRRLMPRALAKRQVIMRRRRVEPDEMLRWFV